MKKGEDLSIIRLFYAFLSFALQVISPKRYIQIASAAAILGIAIVLFNTLFGHWGVRIYALGFALMFLGTLWKAVIEMNSED